MTLDEIQALVDALSDDMMTKGFEDLKAQVEIENYTNPTVWLHYTLLARREMEAFNASKHLEQNIVTARKWIADQPDAKTRNRQAWQAKLGRLIDEGRDSDIELSFLNPLIETAKKLAENAITHQPAE